MQTEGTMRAAAPELSLPLPTLRLLSISQEEILPPGLV